MADTVHTLIPVYKPRLDALELFSIEHSLQQLAGRPFSFVHPQGLDTGFYAERFAAGACLPLPPAFFASHSAYNQLCYEVNFYRIFEGFSHLLLLQPDAIVARPAQLDAWCASPWDYIGGPEVGEYSYDLRAIAPFTQLPKALHAIKLQGLNGGLSLRRIAPTIAALQEYPALTQFFRSYAGGIGEDIFFSLMGRVSGQGFRVPNEVVAARFAISGNFAEWIAFHGGELPFGFHAWYRTPQDEAFVRGIVNGEFR